MGAPLNPVPGVLRIGLEGFVDTSAADTLWVNVLHAQYSGSPPSNQTCASIASNFSTSWAVHIASLCPSPTTLQAVTVTDLTSTSSGSGEYLPLIAGTRGDDSIPANAAVLISYATPFRYKGGKPRTYLYCLGNADLQGATNWSTAATAEVQTKWQAFIADFVTRGASGTNITGMCAIRYRGKFLPNGGPPHFYLTNPIIMPILSTQAIARQKMASQRGRIGRRKK